MAEGEITPVAVLRVALAVLGLLRTRLCESRDVRACTARLNGIYARSIYLPVSEFGRELRALSRRVRGVERGQKTSLAVADWREVIDVRPIRLLETEKNTGDVSLAELAVLASAAAATRAGDQIIEIGTFDGRTTLNLAVNAPSKYRILTLDLPPDAAPKFELAPGERAYVEK